MRHRDFRYQVAEKQAQVQGLTLSPRTHSSHRPRHGRNWSHDGFDPRGSDRLASRAADQRSCLAHARNGTMSTLATSLLHGLRDHGAGEIFGIPGDFVLPFFKVIARKAEFFRGVAVTPARSATSAGAWPLADREPGALSPAKLDFAKRLKLLRRQQAHHRAILDFYNNIGH